MEHNNTYTDYKVRIYADGTKYWYLNDLLHREDGPAVEYASGRKAWYLNGELTREDGPAVECSDGYREWWLNGERYTEDEHAQATQRVEELTLEQVCEHLGKTIKIIK